EQDALNALAEQIVADYLEIHEAAEDDSAYQKSEDVIRPSWKHQALKPPPLFRRVAADREVLQAARNLATEVLRRTNQERNLRQVPDPHPIPVRWTYGSPHLSDWWENICGSTSATVETPLTGNLGQVHDLLHAVPSHRLVVLGRAGAGKTVLTLELVRSFLTSEQRPATSLVPVIFSLASWKPAEQSPRDWMTEQLMSDYPFLRQRTKGKQTIAAELVRHSLVLPILDGLDEMAPELQPRALEALNFSWDDGDPLVLTSRAAEYEAAVDGGDVLTRAAVIQLEDLTFDDLEVYLLSSAKPVKGDIQIENKWRPVIDRLRNAQDDTAAAALLSVLSTPLMVSLARIIYSDARDTSVKPTDLLDTERFSDATALSNHLLDKFIPAVYDHPPQDTEPDRKLPQWSVEDARRWFESLALRAHSRGWQSITQWDEISIACDLVILGIFGIASVASVISVVFFGREVGYFNTAACGLFMGFSTVFINRGYVHYVSEKFIGRVNAGLLAASICIGTVLFGAMWHVGTVWGWIGILLLVFYFLMIFDGTGEDYLHPSDFDPHSVL
ncbi:MAG: NACHT domain-containing protein, partial [Acidobacteria bacterium]|nr:NACHT domain-containing protein [Acidobacteriota bacterium]